MPQIPLTFGNMDLESDQSSKRDNMLSLLYNGFRVGKDVHMWPDHTEFCDLGIDAHVWVWCSVLHSTHYAVNSGRLFRINSDGAATQIANISLPLDTPPTFTEDAHSVFVAAMSPIYRIVGDAAVELAGGQAPINVTSLGFVSGFLVANGDDPAGGGLAGDFAYSDTQGEDGMPTYAVWGYENNASKPDALQALVATTDDYLYAIGTESVDVSYVSGDVTNPFATNKARSQPFGTPARYSVAYDSQSIYYLTVIGGNRQVVRIVGGSDPQIIGFPVTVPINDCERVDDAKGYMMGFRGQSFYVLTLPHANITIDDQPQSSLTLAFNLRAQEWYVLGDWDGQTGRFGAYIGNSFSYDQTMRLVGGSDGKIYTLATEPRVTDPVFTHRWRNNGQLEWNNGRVLSLGEVGQRTVPLKSRGCGRYYQRQDEFVFANGDTRMVIRTGWRNWGKNVIKVCNGYTYDVKRGDAEPVFNGVEESFTVV